MLIEKQTLKAKVMAAIDLDESLLRLLDEEEKPLPKTREQRREWARAGRLQEADRKRAAIAHSRWQLENGATWTAGIAHAFLEPLAGKPGLKELRRQLKELDREIAELEADAAMWPTADTKRKFRYVGRADKHFSKDEGRYLVPGDVVELKKSRATAWRDQFEAIEEVG